MGNILPLRIALWVTLAGRKTAITTMRRHLGNRARASGPVFLAELKHYAFAASNKSKK